jgi:hypothetical protein
MLLEGLAGKVTSVGRRSASAPQADMPALGNPAKASQLRDHHDCMKHTRMTRPQPSRRTGPLFDCDFRLKTPPCHFKKDAKAPRCCCCQTSRAKPEAHCGVTSNRHLQHRRMIPPHNQRLPGTRYAFAALEALSPIALNSAPVQALAVVTSEIVPAAMMLSASLASEMSRKSESPVVK